MEEQRIGMMYVNVLRKRLAGFWDGLFPRGLRRSPLLPLGVIVLVIFVPALGWYLHTRNQFHNIRSHIEGAPANPDLPRPGGLDPLQLTHTVAPGSMQPQFQQVTLLPGLGMDVLQITAFIPGRGTVALLAAPTVKEMADGTAGPRSSPDDLRGALELPWAGGLRGTVALLGTTMMVNWMGHTLELPTEPGGQNGVDVGGLLASHGADSSSVSPDKTLARAMFRGLDFDQHWASSNDIQVLAKLSGTALELTVMATNAGSQPEPMGIGWQPRFVLAAGARDEAQLQLPEGELLDIPDTGRGTPVGRLIALPATLTPYVGHAASLGEKTVEAAIGHLRAAPGSPGPSAAFIDRRSGYGLRLTALSATIRELRLSAPAGEAYVALGLQTNYEDPLGKEWSELSEPGMVTLQPGQTLSWQMRLEIFPAH